MGGEMVTTEQTGELVVDLGRSQDQEVVKDPFLQVQEQQQTFLRAPVKENKIKI